MKQARIIPRSLERPDSTVAEWFEIETIHGDRTHRGSDHAFSTRAEAAAHLEQNGYEIVD